LSESSTFSFSETALTAKASARYLINAAWSVTVNGYGTVLPLSSNLSGTNASFFGLNSEFAYQVPLQSSDYELALQGGFYYVTMTTSGTNFGFRNLEGPEFRPIISRRVSPDKTVAAYFKYALITDSFPSFLGFNNCEIAVGASLGFELKNNHVISVALDYSNLNINTQNIPFTLNTFSLGAGYRF
jgi:hypothetical protein